MIETKQNKAKLNASVSAYAKKKAEYYGATSEFGSLSNFVESALLYFIGSLEKENEIKQKTAEEHTRQYRKEAEERAAQKAAANQEATELLIKIIQTPEGKKAFDKITREKEENTPKRIVKIE